MTAFVFEGVDKAGKTTLLKELKRITHFQLMTVRRPAENGWEAVNEWRQGKKDAETIIEYARKTRDKLDFLLDRFSYSELVYARIFDRPCDFGFYETLLKNNRDVLKLVLVQEPMDIIWDRWRKAGLPPEKATEIVAGYELMVQRLGLTLGEDYYTFSPLSDNINDLLHWIKVHGKNSVRSSN